MFAMLGKVPDADAVFAAAAPFLDRTDPRRFVREADDAALFSNHAGQILCCTQALAAWAMLGDARPASTVLAGYSVGELAAWGCAGVFTPAQVLQLASERATLMDAAAPEGSGLAAIVGLSRPALDRVLKANGAHVAIVNGDDSVVIGGASDALDACLAEASRHGASTARRLRVAVPSHTPLLTSASAAFARVLDSQNRTGLADGIRLLSGIDADVVRNLEAGQRKLASQISIPINWSACLEACRELGASTFLELGPGSALSRMAERMPGTQHARAIDQFHTAGGVREWLARV
jgi:[acyl-carrier-protein] S-malonyltransferase